MANGARLFPTRAWKAEGRQFNKGGALDEAFGFRKVTDPCLPHTDPPYEGEPCLSVDADVYPFGRFAPAQIKPGILYGCPRYEAKTPEVFREYLNKRITLSSLRLIAPRLRGETAATRSTTPQSAAHKCLGYFQLFRYRPGIAFGDSKTAGGYDMRFREKWSERAALDSIHVVHLGEMNRANWAGRVVPKWDL